MHNFRKLEAWKKSRILVQDTYKVANRFPKEEVYGLTSQVKRCSVSIPSNIAEGCGFNSDKQLNKHLEIAMGSAFELETQIILGFDLNYIEKKEAKELIFKINEVSKMIVGFKKTLKL